MPLSAFACGRRGLTSVRANWPLVVVHGVGTLVVAGLLVAGAAVVPLTLGYATAGLPTTLADWADWADWRWTPAEPLPIASLVAGLVATFVVWLLAFLSFCFLQAGTYGVLFAADRQARPGARDWRYFRAFSFRDLCGWGARDLWRYFWFLNLVGIAVGLLAWLAVALSLGAAVGEETWGMPAALGIGCGGLLPLSFLAVVTASWLPLAQALLPRRDLTVWRVAKVGLRVVGKRLGAVFLLCATGLAVALASGVVWLLLVIGFRAWFAQDPGIQLALQGPCTLVQWCVATSVGLVLAASLVAMVRSESGEAMAA